MASVVCVIGDAILDRYIFGRVHRISPEAPVPIMRVGGTYDRPGGACNVAANAQALGADARLMSIVGQDDAGKDLMTAVSSQLSRFHLQQERIETTVKTRYVSGSHHPITVAITLSSPSFRRLISMIPYILARFLKKDAHSIVTIMPSH